MHDRQRPRAGGLNDRLDAAVGRVIRQPIKEAVHEALEERQGTDEDTGDGGRSGRRLVPVIATMLIAAYAVRRWRRSPAEPRHGADAGIEGRAGEFDGSGEEGEGIQVEATADE